MKNKTYREILIRRTYRFSLDVMRFIDTLPQKNFSIQIITHQLIRSATSIGANIIEAQASSSRKDFTNFIRHALKSANESRYWLSLLRDSGKVNEEEAKKLLQEATELAKLLGASITSLKNNN